MASPRAVIVTDDMDYGSRLFHFTNNTGTSEPYFMTFRGLQRTNILRLQNDLGQLKQSAWKHQNFAQDNETLTRLLHDYSRAIQPSKQFE